MHGHDELARQFEEHRQYLHAVAYRMLGSGPEAEDAVQEAWLRLSLTDSAEIESLAAWLRTVVARICLDMLRSRKSRREELAGHETFERTWGLKGDEDPENEALRADSVGRAMLVVLDTLGPAERVAFVLHDMFAVPFVHIAEIVERTPETTKKMASRARQRVMGMPSAPPGDLARQQKVVEAFLAASRAGDLSALLAVLAPDIVRHADVDVLSDGIAPLVRGAQAVARQTVFMSRMSRFADLALVNGAVGVIIAPHGHLLLALAVTVEEDKVTAYDVIADPERLKTVELAVLTPQLSSASLN